MTNIYTLRAGDIVLYAGQPCRVIRVSESAAVEIIRLATDHDWLHKATKEISKYWRNKRKRQSSLSAKKMGCRRFPAGTPLIRSRLA